MFAYLGEMPNIPDSVTCCSRFADRFEKLTGQPYQKNDEAVYRKLVQFGNFDAAFRLAERKLAQAMEDRKKPSQAYPACTVHYLVKEIMDQLKNQGWSVFLGVCLVAAVFMFAMMKRLEKVC